MGLQLASSQNEMIKQRGKEIEQEFEESRKNNFENKYVLGKKLGEGTVGVVYECTLRQEQEE